MKRIRIAWHERADKENRGYIGKWYNDEGKIREVMQSRCDNANNIDKVFYHYIEEEKEETNENH